MSEVRVCDRCGFQAYASGPRIAPESVAAVESVLCGGCKDEVADEVRR